MQIEWIHGLVGGLLGGRAVGTRAVYQVRGDAVRGVLLDADDQPVFQGVGRRLPAALPVTRYTLADPSAAQSDGGDVDVAALNALPSALLRSLSAEQRDVHHALIVLPGYATESQGELRLHPKCEERARLAAALLQRDGSQVILASGGNVHPAGTPFNEAVELRRYLIDVLGVAPWRVAVDPYARHTTTNMRNAGRFLLAHELARGLVATSRDQSFYVAAAAISSFHVRSRRTLGYRVGRFLAKTHTTTRFTPSDAVFQRGDDPLDP